MAHATQQTQRQYNRSFSGSVGSGMQSLMGNNEYSYYLAISEDDCTGCGLCINNCLSI